MEKKPAFHSSASRAPNFISVTLLLLTGCFISGSTSGLTALGSVLGISALLVHFHLFEEEHIPVLPKHC